MCGGMLESRFLDLLDHFDDVEREQLASDRDVSECLDTIGETAEDERHVEEGEERVVAEDEECARLREVDTGLSVLALSREARVASAQLPRQLDLPPPSGCPGCHSLSELSADLRSIVHVFFSDEFFFFPFPTILVDASQPGLPILACNREFCRFSGYSAQELCGQPCFFMADAVPPNLVNDESSTTHNSLSPTALRKQLRAPQISDGVNESMLSPVEIAGTMEVTRKSGEPLRILLDMRQVELDDQPFVIGIEVEIAETLAAEDQDSDVDPAPSGLGVGMAKLEQLLAARYWYSAPLRRQQVSSAPRAA